METDHAKPQNVSCVSPFVRAYEQHNLAQFSSLFVCRIENVGNWAPYSKTSVMIKVILERWAVGLANKFAAEAQSVSRTAWSPLISIQKLYVQLNLMQDKISRAKKKSQK